MSSGICLNCGSKFEDRSNSKNKLYCCTQCGTNSRNRKHRQENPDYYLERRKAENRNLEKRIFTRIKSRAKGKNIPFDLDEGDIVVPELCPILGIKIEPGYGTGTNYQNSPSVDRIDPNKGYTKGNIRVISMRANLLKSNGTLEEFLLIVKDFEKRKL